LYNPLHELRFFFQQPICINLYPYRLLLEETEKREQLEILRNEQERLLQQEREEKEGLERHRQEQEDMLKRTQHQLDLLSEERQHAEEQIRVNCHTFLSDYLVCCQY